MTASTSFPTTAGAFQESKGAEFFSGYLTLIDPGGSGAADLVYSTYVHGAPLDDNGIGLDLALQADGIVHYAATTSGASTLFPITAGAILAFGIDAAVLVIETPEPGSSLLRLAAFLALSALLRVTDVARSRHRMWSSLRIRPDPV